MHLGLFCEWCGLMASLEIPVKFSHRELSVVGDVIRKEDVASSLPQPLEQYPLVPEEPGPGTGDGDGPLHLRTLYFPSEAQARRRVRVFLHSHAASILLAKPIVSAPQRRVGY